MSEYHLRPRTQRRKLQGFSQSNARPSGTKRNHDYIGDGDNASSGGTLSAVKASIDAVEMLLRLT